MKSKGLVTVGIVLIVASLIFAYLYFISPDAIVPLSSVEVGPIKITDISEETAIGLGIFLVIFLTGVGVTVKGFI